jgi:hypothetical protein
MNVRTTSVWTGLYLQQSVVAFRSISVNSLWGFNSKGHVVLGCFFQTELNFTLLNSSHEKEQVQQAHHLATLAAGTLVDIEAQFRERDVLVVGRRLFSVDAQGDLQRFELRLIAVAQDAVVTDLHVAMWQDVQAEQTQKLSWTYISTLNSQLSALGSRLKKADTNLLAAQHILSTPFGKVI